jgi:hypothetical protein
MPFNMESTRVQREGELTLIAMRKPDFARFSR